MDNFIIFQKRLLFISMEKETIQNLIKQNFSIGDISKELDKSKSSIRYWLNFYDLKTNHPNTSRGEKYPQSDKKVCPKCSIEKGRDSFYTKRNKTDFSTYCRDCTKQDTVDRQRLLKQKCVEYKGGRCVECGYNKCLGALEFHHLDPTQKDFAIGDFKLKFFSDTIKKELDKCDLLCSNCHREKHYV